MSLGRLRPSVIFNVTIQNGADLGFIHMRGLQRMTAESRSI